MPHTRPTTDVAKEGLFNIIQNNLDISSLKTLDLFGGTGSISYELASRGCTDLTLVEQDAHLVQFIKKTSDWHAGRSASLPIHIPSHSIHERQLTGHHVTVVVVSMVLYLHPVIWTSIITPEIE